MGWRDDLLPASFRGVAFSVEAHEFRGGRKTVADDLPFTDLPHAQDLGRSTRRFRIQAFVLGDDYVRDRDALLAALESNQGPGELSHPYLGLRFVRVESFEQREQASEGRICRLSIEFLEVAPQRTYPRKSGANSVDDDAGAVQDAGDAELEENLEVEDVPQETIDATATSIASVGSVLEALGTLGGLADEAAALGEYSRTLVLKATSLALAPADAAFAIRAAVDSVANAVTNGLAALRVYQQIEAMVPSVFASDQEQANAGLIVRAARLSALAGWARSLALVEWASYDDAIAARREWEARADAEMLNSRGPLFESLHELASTIAANVPAPDRDLPRVTSYTPPATAAAVVIAYRLYGDSERSQDLVARNRIRNPLLVAGGVPLEVLTRV